MQIYFKLKYIILYKFKLRWFLKMNKIISRLKKLSKVQIDRKNKELLGLGTDSECYDEIIDGAQYILSRNYGLDGVYITVVENDEVYDYFDCQNFEQEFPELNKKQFGKELLHALLNEIPWAIGETSVRELPKELMEKTSRLKR